MKKYKIYLIIWFIYAMIFFFNKDIREYFSEVAIFLIIGSFIEYLIYYNSRLIKKEEKEKEV